MKTNSTLKSFPTLKTDKQAEDFITLADLSEYDYSGFKSLTFEFADKSVSITVEPEVLPGSKK